MKSCFFAALLLSTLLPAQELVISGRIRDANTHREIPSANVYVKELAVGTVSSSTGRFSLRIHDADPEMVVTFQHVAYDTLQMTVEEVLTSDDIEMQERVIALPMVQVETADDLLEIKKDLPQTISVIDAQAFEVSGYSDAGDLLRTDHSIQVDEDLSGKKTLSIRGGSPDEVVVMYNGVRMNNSLDNVFDISLIDLNSIEQFEVIKGSNTALYGPEAFSGVVNMVPRSRQDYNLGFQQRFGTYDSRDWGLNFYKGVGKFHATYDMKKASTTRNFSNVTVPDDKELENSSQFNSANISYYIAEDAGGRPISSASLTYVRSESDSRNDRDNETVNGTNQLISARFQGDGGRMKDVSATVAYQWSDETQMLRFFDIPTQESGFLQRGIESRSLQLSADKAFRMRAFQLLVGYQFRHTRLQFQDERLLKSQDLLTFRPVALDRQHHGIVAIGKLKSPTNSTFLNHLAFDISLRYDIVDEQQAYQGLSAQASGAFKDFAKFYPADSWNEGMVKFSTHLNGNNGVFAFNSFLNIGTNVKFPTLLQQISTRELLSAINEQPHLQPERIHSLELGVELGREVRQESGVFGWKISGNFFRNTYQNKFRSFLLPGTPLPVYDNVRSASINGFETRQSLFLFDKKMTFELGGSRYFFSDPETFPFKNDRKLIFDVRLNQAGYSLLFHAFREGDQVAQLRTQEGRFSTVTIPHQTNIDLHLSKSFELERYRLLLNASVHNLLDDKFELEGLQLRERRYSLTLSLQR